MLDARKDRKQLAERAYSKWKEVCSDDGHGRQQIYIGICGGPGSGKSTVAKDIVEYLHENYNDCKSIVLPMDGYHYSQDALRQLAESQKVIIGDPDDTQGEFTTFDDLMKRRGAPWTFDAERLCHDLRQAKNQGYGHFPLYDRTISDPVENQISVEKQHKIVFVEGNYLLAYDDPAWKPLEDIWDDTWMICVEYEELKERIVNRHLQNWTDKKIQLFGSGREGAVAKAESSDLKNARFVDKHCRPYANLLITNN